MGEPPFYKRLCYFSHIAGRQDSSECALMFMASGGNLDAVNHAGDRPIDCARVAPTSTTSALISVNTLLKETIKKRIKPAAKILSR